MSDYTLFAQYYRELGSLAIGYARVAPVFYLLPFLSDRTVSNAIVKNMAIFMVVLGLWPAMAHPHPGTWGELLALMMQEVMVGLVLGLTLALPFWVATALGELIDNQRGATISDSLDPATGIEASVFSPFVSLMYAAIFLQQGGMLVIVQAIADSYRQVAVGGVLHVDLLRFGTLLTDSVAKGLVLSAPVAIVMFLSDVLLGLFSRFCPQVNAFSLSLSIKSVLAFVILHFYFVDAVPSALTRVFGLHPFAQFFT
ncbi:MULTISPECIES: type III secretion system export apparatus subunit SctT [unclassified Burkholderia]|uniref:type III secretion system export apparatus subunit SctT n=1 Tax=unclassified Burkholderia TaxID=2613784 RepID=UPI000754F7E8|nr:MULTISPECIES: type III secretion system export apparatus subunit SctT [unclassified Burkholderia]KUY81456.1 type III secretion system protein [Burkholderia sp. RF4-BP95]KUY96704.1 type III secretion system protein [Burkholderia sp. RF7-non_BP4]KUZ02919.1 type III secretion system protein [Burkholderia sp. RF7-non_BP1]